MNRLLHHGHLQLTHIPRRLGPDLADTPLPALPHLALFLVGGEVEGDEEEEVGGEDADAGERGELLAGALAAGREVGKVGAGEVGVGGEVDEACGWGKSVGVKGG